MSDSSRTGKTPSEPFAQRIELTSDQAFEIGISKGIEASLRAVKKADINLAKWFEQVLVASLGETNGEFPELSEFNRNRLTWVLPRIANPRAEVERFLGED